MSPLEALAHSLRCVGRRADADDADAMLLALKRLGFVVMPERSSEALMRAAWPGYPPGGPSRACALEDYARLAAAVRLHADDAEMFRNEAAAQAPLPKAGLPRKVA